MQKNNQEIKNLVRECLESSTGHGISNIVRNQNWIIRSIWLFCFSISISYCVFNLTKSFIDYINFNVVTKVSYERLDSIEFPTVSFCNKNPFFVRKPNMVNNLERNLKNQSKLYFDTLLNSSESTLESYITFSYSQSFETLKFKNFLNRVSFSIDDMLINCRFNSLKCTKDDFELIFVSGIGNCFKFNSGKKGKILKSSIPGQKNGLLLEIFTGYLNEEYDHLRSSGVQLFIQNSSNLPFAEFDAINLGTGFETDIWISQEQISKLMHPYSNCIVNIFSPNSFDSYLFRKSISIFGRYQQKTCLLLCYHEYVQQTCGCFSSDAFNITIEQACNDTLSSCVFEALAKFHQTSQSIKCFDSCPIECNSVNYNFKTLKSDFPTPFYAKVLIEHNKMRPNLARNLTTLKNVKDTVLAVNVFYNDISMRIIQEYPAKTFEQLVAETGGFLGLCLGISLLSIVEFFELILKIFLVKSSFKINPSESKI